MKMEKSRILGVKRNISEADGISSIFLDGTIESQPGQFVMVWVPGVDEKPFAVSYQSANEFGITVANVGRASAIACGLKAGDKLGIRGPYGHGYTLDKGIKNAVIVSGGHGAASLSLLAEECARKNINVKFILGARAKDKLIYAERMKKLLGSSNVIITTDDGSAGLKGFVTEPLKALIEKGKIDRIFACGPEKMLKAVAELCVENHVKGEVSLERYFKCGFGLCGHCCVDPSGFRLCVEGPVVDFQAALKIKEFGDYRRAKSSRKEKI